MRKNKTTKYQKIFRKFFERLKAENYSYNATGFELNLITEEFYFLHDFVSLRLLKDLQKIQKNDMIIISAYTLEKYTLRISFKPTLKKINYEY